MAKIDDLQKIKEMYKDIVENMNKNNIRIWDEIYPCEFFEEDIKNKTLYIMMDGLNIIGGFALYETNQGTESIKWEKKQAKSLYLDRLGINVNYLHKGFGSKILRNAIQITKKKKAEYLRLFIVDFNEPAKRLYLKNGFKKAEGSYKAEIDEDIIFNEFGYEIKIS